VRCKSTSYTLIVHTPQNMHRYWYLSGTVQDIQQSNMLKHSACLTEHDTEIYTVVLSCPDAELSQGTMCTLLHNYVKFIVRKSRLGELVNE